MNFSVTRTFEFKWNSKSKNKQPKIFTETYPNTTYQVVTPDNFWEFVK